MRPGEPLVPVDEIEGPLRDRIDLVAGVGGDLTFYRWAANAPGVADFYWGDFYRDLFFKGVLSVRLKELVRLRLAGVTGCGFCSAGDRASAREHGVTDAEIDAAFAGALAQFADERERAALKIATDVAYGVSDSSQELLARFQAAEAVELVMVTGVLAGVGRMLVATRFVDPSCIASAG